MDTTDTTTETAKTVANLRTLADALEQLPAGIPAPTHLTYQHYQCAPKVEWLLFSLDDEAEQKAQAAAIVKALGGRWDKNELEHLFQFTRADGPVHYKVTVSRPAVCERVVTGTRERVIPAIEAQPERVETVEDVEWRCQPLLADETTQAVTQ